MINELDRAIAQRQSLIDSIMATDVSKVQEEIKALGEIKNMCLVLGLN